MIESRLEEGIEERELSARCGAGAKHRFTVRRQLIRNLPGNSPVEPADEKFVRPLSLPERAPSDRREGKFTPPGSPFARGFLFPPAISAIGRRSCYSAVVDAAADSRNQLANTASASSTPSHSVLENS